MAELKAKIGLDTTEFETGVGRIQNQVGKLSSGNLAGGFKNLAADLARANSPAEALSQTFGRLGDMLKGTIFGAAGLAIGKMLAAPFEQTATIVKESTDIFQNALQKMQDAGDAVNFDQAISQVQNLADAVRQIDDNIKRIDENFFTRIASKLTGSTTELEKQKATLMMNAGGRLGQGLIGERQRNEFTQGMSTDDRQLLAISDRQRAREQTIRSIFAKNWSPVADQALEESFNLFVQERNAKLEEIAQRTRTSQAMAKLKMEEDERAMEAKSYERGRDSRREAMLEDFRRGLNEARDIVNEAEKRGVPVEQIQQERAIKSFDQAAVQATRDGSPLQVLADNLQQVGGGGRFAQVGGETRELVGKADAQLKALQEIAKNTATQAEGAGVQ